MLYLIRWLWYQIGLQLDEIRPTDAPTEDDTDAARKFLAHVQFCTALQHWPGTMRREILHRKRALPIRLQRALDSILPRYWETSDPLVYLCLLRSANTLSPETSEDLKRKVLQRFAPETDNLIPLFGTAYPDRRLPLDMLQLLMRHAMRVKQPQHLTCLIRREGDIRICIECAIDRGDRDLLCRLQLLFPAHVTRSTWDEFEYRERARTSAALN